MSPNRIKPELLKRIKDSVNLMDVVGEHVVLRRTGANATGLCPFHSERTPSFSVNESKQLYYCYGCKRGGDLISFVMDVMGISFPEAIEDLAERSKINLPKDWQSHASADDEKAAEKREKQTLSFKLNRFVAAYFRQNLSHHFEAKQYLNQRGIVSESILNSFYLGASHSGWQALARHLEQKKAPLDLACELGLIRPSPKGPKRGHSSYFDLFRNRVMFPILDLRGKVSGFGGRSLQADQNPKYLNSPESPVFYKGKLAFGLYQSQKFIREQDELILVEGYFDVLGMHAAGFQNVVATCGTALTQDHLKIFSRLASKIIVMFDSDAAGMTATERAMELALDQGLILYGAKLPERQDPDDVLMNQKTGASLPNGLETMKTILSSARPLLDEKMDEAIHLAETGPQDLTQSLKKIGTWLKALNDPVGQAVRAELVQTRLGVSAAVMREVLGLKSVPRARPLEEIRVKKQAKNPANAPKETPIDPVDRLLLQGLIRNKSNLEFFLNCHKDLPPGQTLGSLFQNSAAQFFVDQLVCFPEAIDQFQQSLEKELEQNLDAKLRAVLVEALVLEDQKTSTKDFQIALLRRVARKWAQASQGIKSAMTDAEDKNNHSLLVRLMKDYLDVQRKMKEFINFYDEE